MANKELEDLSSFEAPTPFSSLPIDSHIITDPRNRFLLVVDFNKADFNKNRQIEHRLVEILRKDELYQIKHLNFDHCRGVGECLLRIAQNTGRVLDFSKASISAQRAVKSSDLSAAVLTLLAKFAVVDLSCNGKIACQLVPALVTSAFESEKCCIQTLILDECSIDFATLELFGQWLEIPYNQLKKLSVRNCGLGISCGNGHSDTLFEYLIQALRDYGQLTSLDVSQNSYVDAYVIVESLSNCEITSLRELKMEYVQMTDDVSLSFHATFQTKYCNSMFVDMQIARIVSCLTAVPIGNSESCKLQIRSWFTVGALQTIQQLHR